MSLVWSADPDPAVPAVIAATGGDHITRPLLPLICDVTILLLLYLAFCSLILWLRYLGRVTDVMETGA